MESLMCLDQAPAIYTDHAMPGASQRYSFVPTTAVVEQMAQMGWMPAAAQQTNCRKLENKPYCKHLIKFQRPGLITCDGEIPQVIAVNSHDRKTALQFYFGIYRIACCNGLIIAKAEVGRVRMLHSGIMTGEVSSLLGGFVRQLDKVITKIDQAKQTILGPSQALEFAERAADLRWPDNKQINGHALLTTRRSSDQSDSLWMTYNVVQENIINGGFESGLNRTPKRIRGLNRSIELNTKLWDLAEKYM